MKHTKLIEPINEAQTYSGWSDEPLESGYYICVDTDYSYQGTGEEVAYIGTEEEAMEAQHSSEGHVEGPFASEEEAREEAINQGYRLLGESKQKRTVTLSEAQLRKVITESVKRIIKEEYDQFSDDDFASDGDPYGLIQEPIGEFKVTSIVVDGEDVSRDFFSIAGQTFDSKYDFRDNLNQYLKEMFNEQVYDLDTAAEFGEEGDRIYVNTNSDCDVQVRGGYIN